MQNRRKFIKNSLMTAAGAGFTGKFCVETSNSDNSSDSKFIYRTLGKTGIKLPVVSMGTGNTENPALVKAALEKGVKLLGTSGAYQNGNNERMVGTAIRDLPRDSFMVMTSNGDLAWIDTQTGILNDAFTYAGYLKKVQESLKRLGIEYVDILIQPFAAKRESVFHEPMLKAIELLKKEGLIRYSGISTHRNEPEAIRAAADVGIHDILMTSYNFIKTNMEELEDAISYAAKAGLGIIAMKTMAGAFWDKERTKPINARAALKWVLQNENIHTTVPDCSDFDQLTQDIGIMTDPELSESEKRDLVPPSGEATSSVFCQQCGECISQCPHGLDIPTLMRSYMYAYGHHNLPHALYAIKSTGLTCNPCTGCTSCNICCKMGFDIREKICDISRIIGIPQDLLHV